MQKDKVVVYIHGLHGSSKEVEDYSYLKDEYDVVGLPYEDGNPWEMGSIIKDGFKSIVKDYKEVVVIGYSIGAFYTYEHLSDFNIKKAFFISPVGNMFKLVCGMMKNNGVTEEELKKEKFIRLKNGQLLSYDDYDYLRNHEDNWNVETHILYGAKDVLVTRDAIDDFMNKHPHATLLVKEDSEHRFRSQEEKEFIKNWIIKNI